MKCVLAWAHMFVQRSVFFSLKRAGGEAGDRNRCSMQSNTYYIKEPGYLKKTVPERNQDNFFEMVPGTDKTSQNRQYYCQNYC